MGHRWATWPTYPWNRCRSKGAVAHGERSLCHAWPTHPDGAFGAVRAVHEASPHSIMGALVAPPGRQVRHGPAHIRRSRGPGFLWRTPPEARSRSYAWAASGMLSRPLGGTASAAPAPAQWFRGFCLLPPAAYRQLCAIAGVWFATDGCVVRCRRSVAWYEFWRAARSRCPHLSIKIGLIVTNSRRNWTITDQ